MKVFITGGTGVLGKRVVRKLVEQSHEVVVLTRSLENDTMTRALGAIPKRGDIFSVSDLIALTKECDVILHLATHIPKSAMPKRAEWILNDRLRVDATRCLLEAAHTNHIKKIIVPSVLALYGQRSGSIVNSSSPLLLKSHRVLKSAYEMEQLVMKSGIEYVVMRYGTYYAEDCYHTMQLVNDVRKRKMPLIGKGDFLMNQIHADDAANAMIHVMKNFFQYKNTILNISDYQPRTYHELLSWCVAKTGSKPPHRIPAWLAKMVLGDIFSYITASFTILPNERLSWKPVHSFEQTIEAILKVEKVNTQLINN